MIVVHTDRCTGCDLCLLVCSYHQTGGFNARHALLRIDRSEMGEPLQIAFTEGCDTAPADPCFALPRPACSEACPPGALGWEAGA